MTLIQSLEDECKPTLKSPLLSKHLQEDGDEALETSAKLQGICGDWLAGAELVIQATPWRVPAASRYLWREV